MKLEKRAALAATIIICVFVMLLTAGCGGGGKTNQNLSSPWYGDLYGVATEPANGETNIALNSWVHVYWPDGNYPPPASFTLKLQKEERPDTWGDIHTVLSNADSNPAGGSWWFQPESNFSPNTSYRIIITDDHNRQAIAYFRTTAALAQAMSSSPDGTRSAQTAGKLYCPAGAENKVPTPGTGSASQVITVK